MKTYTKVSNIEDNGVHYIEVPTDSPKTLIDKVVDICKSCGEEKEVRNIGEDNWLCQPCIDMTIERM